MVKSERNRDRDFKGGRVPLPPITKKNNAGAFVHIEERLIAVEPVLVTEPGFTTEDILWAVGIWSVILTMSPMIVFYMLMVA